MTNEMELVVGCDGDVRCIYDEALDLRKIGKLQIARASHVEPDAEGYWWADMGPSGGPVLGPYESRSEAVSEEVQYLSGKIGYESIQGRGRSLGLSPAVTEPTLPLLQAPNRSSNPLSGVDTQLDRID